MSNLLITDFLLVGPEQVRTPFGRTACEKATWCLQMVRCFPMENFHFCSIYMLAMTQDSEIILTTFHSTLKSQMYYTYVVFINGKAYTHYNADS